jgi:CheY-like chemotaxis protein
MSKSILVIDDDKICNFLTVNAFRKAGIEGVVNVVINGLEALKKLKEDEIFPDLILLDINMPIMDGISFLKKYKQEGFEGKSKIVMYTSSIREVDKDLTLQFKDVFEFVSKPLSIEKLKSLIQII